MLKTWVLGSYCAGSDCHGSDEFHVGLNPNDPELYDTLMTTAVPRCGNRVLVVPGDPEASALMKALKGECEMTPIMPAGCIPGEGGGCIYPEVIEAIGEWITKGAPEEE